MKKAIVMGAAGFIGNAVVKQLEKEHVETIAVVKPGTKYTQEAWRLEEIKSKIVECDLEDVEKLEQIINDREFDVFYQFAWDGLDRKNLFDYKKQIKNIEYMMNSIVVASKLKCKKFIGVGTITQAELVVQEGRKANNDKHIFFKVAQQACEDMGRSVACQEKIEFYWPIIINIYGEGEVSERLINTMIRNLQEGRHQPTSEGEQKYDFLYITDAAKALYLIGEKGKPNSNYVLGSGNPQPLKKYLKILENTVNSSGTIGWGELPYNGIELPDKYYDTSQLYRDTGFLPEISFEEGIRKTAEWIYDKKQGGEI